MVICVIKAKFLTNPHASPSGVSEVHNIPNCEGCKALGPETLRDFSNCEEILVIIPSADI